MQKIEVNTWYNCVPDAKRDTVELCKICMFPDARYHYSWHIVTFYNGFDVFGGSLKDCINWIKEHKTDRRYLDNGKV